MTTALRGERAPVARRQSAVGLPARGLGVIAVIVVLVVLASMAAAVLRLNWQAQSTASQDVLGIRASSAARAGIEWGLYQVFKGTWTTCANQSQAIDLSTDFGMRVTVTCHSVLYNEGESAPGVPRTVRSYQVEATACNSTVCPDATAAVRDAYVERRRQVQATN